MMKSALRRLTSKPNTKIPDWLRGRAEVYAALANVADLSELESWQKAKLVADALKARVISNVSKKKTAEARRLFASLKRNGIPPEWLVLAEIHPWTHRFINDILDHGKADVREFQKHISRPEEILILEDFGTCISYERQDLRKQVCQNLWETLTTSGIFLFRRCPICRTIFVMNGKQKYCDQKCTARAAGPRTDYMREYMKDRRAAIARE